MPKNSLSLTDNRTGKSYEIPIEDGAVRALDLRQIKVDDKDFGLMTYDPGYGNTAACKSRITFVDGDAGILEYRGYPIEQLAEHSNFLEVGYLLVHGELPTADQMSNWVEKITHHTLIHENIKSLLDAFRYDAHPMAMWISTVAALSSFYPDARRDSSAEARMLQVYRLIAKAPTIAAFSFRHAMGQRYNYPDNRLSYSGNFLQMMFHMTDRDYHPQPALERALDVLFILHADHEQNCSTSVLRGIGSSLSDPYSAVAGAAAALYGPLHGGANEEVLRTLNEIGSVARVPEYIKRVKAGEFRLMGFGHRVYRNYDPRAKLIKHTADAVFEVVGRSPLIDIALELERIALADDYFVQRKLYPNVDFYSGIIYQALGLPVAMFPVLFAIPRTVGWLAQWLEMINDPDLRIARPRQVYLGPQRRDFVPQSKR